MVIKIAKKEDISSDKIQSFIINQWEIIIFHVEGKYCFYLRSTEIENSYQEFKNKHKRPPEDRLQVVIDEDDIFVLVNDAFLEEEYNETQFFEKRYLN